jgi:hypothetical protein
MNSSVKSTFKFKIKVRANGVYKQVVVEVTIFEKETTDNLRDKCKSDAYIYANRT